jgi:hypothetical protein
MIRRLRSLAAVALVGIVLMLGLPAAASATAAFAQTYGIAVTGTTTATLLGIINPENEETSYDVQWDVASSNWCTSGGTSGSPAHTTTPTALDPSWFPSYVNVDLTGMTYETSYCAQFVATNADGEGDGGQLTWVQSVPDVHTFGAHATSATSAVVEGEVNPRRAPTFYEAEYAAANSDWCTSTGTSGAPSNSFDLTELGFTDDTFHPVSVKLLQLTPGETYCARLVANSSGEGEGQLVTFTVNAPGAFTLDAYSTGGSTATVEGEINAAGVATTYQVQYDLAGSAWCTSGGSSSSPAHTTSAVDFGFTDESFHDFSVDLSGLTAAQDWCAQLIATNANGTAEGGQKTWTQGHEPVAETLDAFSTGGSTVTVEGFVNPFLETTTYQVQYDLASSLWCTSDGISGSPADTTTATSDGLDLGAPGFQYVAADLTGRTELESYCARLIASNANGEDDGDLVTWTQGAPFADTFEIDPTGDSTATFDGDVNPAGKATSYDVQYDVAGSQWCESGGSSGSPANSTATTPLAFTDGAFHEVLVDLAGLTQGTTYCADIVATNVDGTLESFQEYWTQPIPPPPPVTLTVRVQGTGGNVTSSPTGINCSSSTCSASFAPGTKVTLTASGGSFLNWLGLCLGGFQTNRTCTVEVDSNMVVTANFAFAVIPPRVLTVSRTGSGTGAVTSSPTAIRCGSLCSGQFPAGSRVTLTAFADTGSTFAGWSGGGCSGTGTCTVTLTADQTVTATFNHILTVTSCKVPKLKGKKLAAAKTAIRSAHCAVGKVTKSFSAKVKKGRVISQKPAAGSRHPAGTKIKLTVSKGKKP